MIESKSISNNYKNCIFESSFLGIQDFKKSVQLQKDLLTLSLKNKNNFIIGLEHPAVITLGYRAEIDKEIYAEINNMPIERISRGGLATIHSEGQLVVYPVLNLRELNLGVREYVLLLLETTQELLKSLGVESIVDEEAIGLYTEYGKIAFCGIQIKNGISQHGLSLNVRNNLSLFSTIRACGLDGQSFDSLSHHGVNLTLSELYAKWVEIFKIKINWSSL